MPMQNDLIKQELIRTRLSLQEELKRAKRCKTPAQKIKLHQEWLKQYSQEHVKTLINILKDDYVCNKILNWDVINFKKKL